MPPFKLKVAHDSTQVCSLNQTIYTRAPSPHFPTTFWPVCMRVCSKFSPDALFWFPFIYDPIIPASPSSTLRYWTKSHHGNLSLSSMRVWHQHLQIQSLDYFSIKILLNGFPAFWVLWLNFSFILCLSKITAHCVCEHETLLGFVSQHGVCWILQGVIHMDSAEKARGCSNAMNCG